MKLRLFDPTRKAIKEENKLVAEFFKDIDLTDMLIDKHPMDEIMKNLRKKYEHDFIRKYPSRYRMFQYTTARDMMDILMKMYPVHWTTINHNYCLQWDVFDIPDQFSKNNQ